MKNKYDFEYCMRRDCKTCNRFIYCKEKEKNGSKKNKDFKAKRSRV